MRLRRIYGAAKVVYFKPNVAYLSVEMKVEIQSIYEKSRTSTGEILPSGNFPETLEHYIGDLVKEEFTDTGKFPEHPYVFYLIVEYEDEDRRLFETLVKIEYEYMSHSTSISGVRFSTMSLPQNDAKEQEGSTMTSEERRTLEAQYDTLQSQIEATQDPALMQSLIDRQKVLSDLLAADLQARIDTF